MSSAAEDRVDRVDRVVVVGGGLSGLATALGVGLRGRPVTVLEAGEQLGGAAAYSGGQVWVAANHVAAQRGMQDDLQSAESYVRGIAPDAPELLDEAAMLRWLSAAPEAVRWWEEVGAVRWTVIDGLSDYHADVPGALGAGRYLTGEPFDARWLGSWRERLRTSPYFRMGTTYADLVAHGRRGTASEADSADLLTYGTGLVAGFLCRALETGLVDLRLQHRVTRLLLGPDGGVVGVEADSPDGPVQKHGPVVLATSSYDWDPDLVRRFTGLEPVDAGSLAPPTLQGDGIRLAEQAGGAVVSMPAASVPMVPGWRAPTASGFENGPDYALPHAFIVDASGRRFCDDSYWPSLVPRVVDDSAAHRPFFLVWDDEHRRAYGLGSTPAGGSYPDGVVTSAPTLRELGAALGVDGERLEATAREFNGHAVRGEDPAFGRGGVEFIRRFSGDPQHEPNPLLGPVEQAPFHGLRLCLLGVGIGASGIHANAEGEVLDAQGAVVPGLHAVGSCVAATTFGGGYNSGFALSRGLTLAHLVAQQLARPAASVRSRRLRDAAGSAGR